LVPITSQQRMEMLARLEEIEHAVNKMRVPASFADQFYFLRGHINFVRIRLADGPTAARSTGH
jgi:hypothetical protein